MNKTPPARTAGVPFSAPFSTDTIEALPRSAKADIPSEVAEEQ